MIIVAGATGFIGENLVVSLAESTDSRLRAITRKHSHLKLSNEHIEYLHGDISDHNSLSTLLVSGATFINLAYSSADTLKEAITATAMMVEVCAEKKIKRLIHCSSISVYGRVRGHVTERTPCSPRNEYGKIKLAIEQTLLEKTQGRFELIILRPSEVFGIGSQNLVSLINSLVMGNQAINYIRSSLFGHRNTHFVPVDTVVDAIQFLCTDQREYGKEIFIVSADEEPLNNFHDIEELLMEELALPQYPFSQLKIPNFILELILLIIGRATIASRITYSSSKLKESGFHNNHDIEQKLRKFVQAYKKYRLSRTN